MIKLNEKELVYNLVLLFPGFEITKSMEKQSCKSTYLGLALSPSEKSSFFPVISLPLVYHAPYVASNFNIRTCGLMLHIFNSFLPR